MTLIRNARGLWDWYSRRGLVEEVALVFTLVTVLNSAMMVIGWDRPKDGVFASVHLLGRLGIVTLIVLLWESSSVSAALGALLRQGRAGAPWAASIDAAKAWLAGIPRNRAAAVAVLYTLVVTTFCVVTIAFQALLRPMGGAALYGVLLLVFAVVTLLVCGTSHLQRRGK